MNYSVYKMICSKRLCKVLYDIICIVRLGVVCLSCGNFLYKPFCLDFALPFIFSTFLSNTQPHLQCPKPLRCHKSPIDSEILFLSININLLILLENIKLKKFKSTTSSPSLSQPVGHLYISL